MTTGATRVAGLIGYPARYSLSPVLHDTAYRSLGLDMTYVVFPVEPQRVRAAVEAVRALDLVGLSVTMPHKEAVIPFLDDLAPEAERLRAVNTIVRNGDRLVGHNTDGVGLVRSLQADLDFDVKGRRIAVLGAGGAARAAIGAFADYGAAEIVVINRSVERAGFAKSLAPDIVRIGSSDDLAEVDLIVNATPIGMEGTHVSESPVSAEIISGVISEKHLVIDLIYRPSQTVLLELAQRQGAKTGNGLGMLVHQAAEQIRLWTGREASTDLMHSAVESA